MAAALAAAAGVASCASADPVASGPHPDWFVAQAKALDAKGFPSLSAIPRASGPGRSGATWSAIGAELRAEGAQVLASPRNVPADLKDLESFEAEARRAATPPPAQGTPMTSTAAKPAQPKAP
ncbi:MAG: hypothetical protein KJS97_12540 [Alphaproteobacteria bacterium]|nr:hypothetical protein [Alphaproteobacteria bacterium]